MRAAFGLRGVALAAAVIVGCGSSGSRGCVMLVGPDGGPCQFRSDATCMWRAGCPSGEQCSDLATQGLTFFGPPFRAAPGSINLDRTVKPVAVGGTEMLTFNDFQTARPPTFPNVSRFDAPTLTVVSSDMGGAVVRGASAGMARFRVEDVSGRYIDAIELRSAPIASVALSDTSEGYGWRANGPAAMTFSIAMRTSASRRVSLTLRDARTQALVDESLTLTATCTTLTAQRDAWDLYTLSAAADGPCTLTLVAGTTNTWTLDVLAAPAPDDFALSTADSQASLAPGSTIPLGGMTRVCFRATLQSRPMLGVGWTFESSANVRRLLPIAGSNCAVLEGLTTGPATLTATATGGVARTYHFDVAGP